jgi:hypothetical protein
MREIMIGDLVRLKPAHVIRARPAISCNDPDDSLDYDPDDWVGVVVGFCNDNNSKILPESQIPLFYSCYVMWRGRSPVSEFVDHLELIQ